MLIVDILGHAQVWKKRSRCNVHFLVHYCLMTRSQINSHCLRNAFVCHTLGSSHPSPTHRDAGSVKVEHRTMQFAAKDQDAPPAKRQRAEATKIAQLPVHAFAHICMCAGMKERFLFGGASRASRRLVFDQPQLWSILHLDHVTLADLVRQTTHVRKHGMDWLDTYQHPINAVEKIYISLYGLTKANPFKLHHFSTTYHIFMGAAFVRITGTQAMIDFREFLFFLYYPMIRGTRRLPLCCVTDGRFTLERGATTGVTREMGLELIEQGRLLSSIFPGLPSGEWGWTGQEAEKICIRIADLLTRDAAATSCRARII